MQRKAFYSKNIHTEQGVMDGYLVIEGEEIVAIQKDLPRDTMVYDCPNYHIIPGIIDIHNHGFAGWSMTDEATIEDVMGFAQALSGVGVTGVLPTGNELSFKATAETIDTNYTGAKIFGIHSEGPFWARGGENTVGMTWPSPSIELTDKLVKMCQGKMYMMAIAPELPGAYDVINYLHEHEIKVACCHTKATAKQIQDANKTVKLDIATHLGNGMQGIHHRDV